MADGDITKGDRVASGSGFERFSFDVVKRVGDVLLKAHRTMSEVAGHCVAVGVLVIELAKLSVRSAAINPKRGACRGPP